MTLAASTPTDLSSSKRWTRTFHMAAPCLYVAATFVVLIAFLTLTPDGVAEPVQTVAGWLVGGGVAALAVSAVVKGLERLLDCDSA